MRHKHERQAVVFGVLIALLAISGLAALAVYTGALVLPGDPEFVTAEPTGTSIVQSQACVPDETYPVAYSQVQVTVLNGSTRSGLASTVAEMLADRGFDILGAGNDTRQPIEPLISFGPEGIAQAYTLLAHYPTARLVLDARVDDTVDLTVPQSFEELEPVESVTLDPETPLVSVPECADPATITPLPLPAHLAPTTEEGDEGDAGDEQGADDADAADEPDVSDEG